MPSSNPYFMNPSAGFTPSPPTPVRSPIQTGQTGELGQTGGQLPFRQAPGPVTPAPYTTNQLTGNQTYGSAVRPTDQSNNPQAAWMQNMATFAGGQMAGSNAFGNQPGPVRRLVDVLGQQPFGEQNPMTLLMQALQNSNFGLPMPDQTPAPTTYRPPNYSNPVWGSPERPIGFNPRQMMP